MSTSRDVLSSLRGMGVDAVDGSIVADEVDSESVSEATTSLNSMSDAASSIFKVISPHLPPDKAPKVLRLISDSFANAQSRISTAEAMRDSMQQRLRQSEAARKSKFPKDKQKMNQDGMMIIVSVYPNLYPKNTITSLRLVFAAPRSVMYD